MSWETCILQDTTELESFLELIRQNAVSSFLEVGSKYGGSFWRISNSLAKGARVVSVDLPFIADKESEPRLWACVGELCKRGYDAHVFFGDSTDPMIVDAVRELSPFDLVFIDANHTEPYVRKDWENYGSLGRMVAFHDIGWPLLRNRALNKAPIEVAKVWDELKLMHRHVEIRHCPEDNGIGVLWRR